jgi:hypothetical protein
MNHQILCKGLRSTRFRIVGLLLITIEVALVHCTTAQPKRPMSFEDLMKVQRLSDVQISPDGGRIVYVQTAVNLLDFRVGETGWEVTCGRREVAHRTWRSLEPNS